MRPAGGIRPAFRQKRDLKVPDNADGDLADFAGAPWWAPLAYCNAVWGLAAGLTDEGPEKGSYLQRAVAFRTHGESRLRTDRSMAPERATSAFTAISNGYALVLRRTQDRAALLAKGGECQGVLAGYNAANR